MHAMHASLGASSLRCLQVSSQGGHACNGHSATEPLNRLLQATASPLSICAFGTSPRPPGMAVGTTVLGPCWRGSADTISVAATLAVCGTIIQATLSQRHFPSPH